MPTKAADTMDGMGDMGDDGQHSAEQFAPLVGGIYEDGPVSFIHTETSDEGVATMLTEMVAVTKSGIVVNFPLLVWPGGSR